MTEAEAREWVAAQGERWAQERRAEWAVTDGGRLLGRTGLTGLDLWDGLAEVAYWVVPAARGAGVATRALAALTRWCLDDVGLHRLQLRHSMQNPASCRVALAGGYPLEGVQRRQGRHADGWHDMHLHARLADDPRLA